MNKGGILKIYPPFLVRYNKLSAGKNSMKRSFAILIAVIVFCSSAVIANSETIEDGLRYLSLGESSALKMDYASALDYYKKAERVFKENDGERAAYYVHIAVGEVYRKMGEYEEALSYAGESLSYMKKTGDIRGIGCSLNVLGLTYWNMNKYDKALPALVEALKILEEVGEAGSTGDNLLALGEIYLAFGDSEKALAYFMKAAPILSGAYDRSIEARLFINIGDIYWNMDKPEEAFKHYRDALNSLKGIVDGAEKGISLFINGATRLEKQENEKALEYLEQALPIFRGAGIRTIEGVILAGIGEVYLNTDKYDDALLYTKKGLEIIEDAGNKTMEVSVLYNMGLIHYSLGDFDKSLEYYQRSLKLAREKGNQYYIVNNTFNMGVLSAEGGQYEKALDILGEALSMCRKQGDRLGELKAISNIGSTYFTMGYYDKALPYFEEAIALSKKIKDRTTTGTLLRNVGNVYRVTGEYEKALAYFSDSLKIKREIGDQWEIGAGLNDMGLIYTNLGQHEKALDYYKEALKIFRKTGDRKTQAVVLGNMGVIYSDNGRFDEALASLEEALEINRELKIKPSEAITLNNLGGVYWRTGRYEKSLSFFEEACKIFDEIGKVDAKGTALLDMSAAYWGMKQYNKAILNLEKALSIANQIRNVENVYLCAWGLGRSYRGLGQRDKAIQYYIMSINALESMRTGLKSEGHKMSFSSNKMEVYEELIDLLLETGRVGDAFNYVERARSRAFLDMLATKRPEVRKATDKELLKEEEEIRHKLMVLSEKRSSGEASKARSTLEDTNREIDEIEKRYSSVIREIQAKSPELASLVSVNPFTLKEVQGFIPEGVGIIEFFTTDDKVILFSIDRAGTDLYQIEVNRSSLNEKVNGLRDSLLTFDLDDFQYKSRELYDLLLSSALKDVKGEKLIIIPHGPLHYLPFAALYDGEKYIVDRYTVIVDPSASVLRFIVDKRKGIGGRVLAFGNPKTNHSSLPYAEKEVGDIKAVMGDVDIYVEDRATETLGKEKFPNYNVIHLASHGKFKEEEPLLSSLYLAEDGKNDGVLMVHELFGLDLNKTSLVVLSACETGLAKVTGGDELIGLSRGFTFAGTPSLVVTLWEVSDDSTAELMVEFYKNLKSGMDKPDALREAQIILKSNEKYKHPFYWAPFVIIGDWK